MCNGKRRPQNVARCGRCGVKSREQHVSNIWAPRMGSRSSPPAALIQTAACINAAGLLQNKLSRIRPDVLHGVSAPERLTEKSSNNGSHPMKTALHSIAVMCLFLFFICPDTLHAAPSIRRQIDLALMGNQPLESIRAVSQLPRAQLIQEGIEVEANLAAGYDEVIHIRFDPALHFHGASTQEVILSFDNPYKNFHALVYGVFAGDLDSFVQHLALKPGTPANTHAIGKYNRPLSASTGCPITLGASPIDSTHFVFGTGWCNGDE